jgi:hypothetical protein
MRLTHLSSFANRSSPKTVRDDKSNTPPIYQGHSHFAQRALSRRGFLGLTAAASGLAFTGLAAPPLAGAATASRLPNPIPNGLQLLGPDGPLFHLFLPGPTSEPSTITDFHGFVGLANVGGRGTRTESGGKPHHLFFDSDNRFMSGVFVGRDGKVHHGTFGFV